MRGGGSRAALAAGALAVAAGVLALGLPPALADWWLVPDAIEYAGIAHSLAAGAGFVDPIVYSHYLPPAYPMPAAAARPPLVPLLLAVPFGLGASIEAAAALHVAWAALVAAGVVVVAARWAGPAAGLAAGLGFALSFGWNAPARMLLTETTSAALVLALVVAAPRAARGARGAAAFAGLCFLAWLCRPNLVLALPALLAAWATAAGPRAVLRARAAWVALGVLAALAGACWVGLAAATGLPPYAHHGVLLETLGAEDARYYQREYVGALRYFAAHAQEVARLLLWNVRHVARSLFVVPDWHYAGWLALPGVAAGLRARGRAALERRFAAWLFLSQVPPAFLVPGSVEPMRLSLVFALCGWLLGAALAQELLERAAARLRSSAAAAALRIAAPTLALATFACSPSGPYQVGIARASLRDFAAHGTRARGAAWVAAAPVCPALERDALVASTDPWAIYLWCGNLGLWLPVDLESQDWVRRYLDEQAPGFVVVDRSPAYAQVRRSPALAHVASFGELSVYRVLDAPPRSRPWRAPPPLAGRSGVEPEPGSVFQRRRVRVR